MSTLKLQATPYITVLPEHQGANLTVTHRCGHRATYFFMTAEYAIMGEPDLSMKPCSLCGKFAATSRDSKK